MKQLPKTMVMLCAAGLLTITPPLASAKQPKDKPKKGNVPQKSTETKDQPKVAVIANVQVNISTWINLGSASGKPQSPPERKTESGKEPSVSDLLSALEKASEGGSAVVVLTHVKIDISTWLNIGPSPGNAPPGIKQKQKTGQEKKPVLMPASGGVDGGSPDKQADELFELHVRIRRTAGGVDVLLAGTAPSANGAAAAAERINQLRDHGMVGLLVLPLILKTNPDTHRALRTAMGSVKAEASGTRLTLTASIPNEAVEAASEVVNAARRFAKGLVGQQ